MQITELKSFWRRTERETDTKIQTTSDPVIKENSPSPLQQILQTSKPTSNPLRQRRSQESALALRVRTHALRTGCWDAASSLLTSQFPGVLRARQMGGGDARWRQP